MKKYLLGILMICVACVDALAISLQNDQSKRLTVRISKSGLNRIANPPYQITQVTGDDTKFRLKYDEDGANIYLMPLVSVGDAIELSIKNNAGTVQDLELVVTNIKGQVIIIDGARTQDSRKLQKQDVAEMMQAMHEGSADKFYVQIVKTPHYQLGEIRIKQTSLYKWKNLAGGVYEISNETKMIQKFDFSAFVKQFANVRASFISKYTLSPRETARVFIVQQLED